ncbi:MAG: hypothetical protein P1P84_13495 [Deferrisomatales bacterium]|nr:hypothetical protein [Deferrisomatales bacterium]
MGEKIATAPMNNHMDINVPMEKDAVYTVKALVGGAEGDPSAAGVVAGVKPLDPPTWAGELVINNQLNLRWDTVQGAAFYNVFKGATKEGPFALVGSVQEGKYIDTTVEPGKTYYYQVSAVDKNNAESPKSATFEAIIKVEVKKATVEAYDYAEQLLKFQEYWYGSVEIPINSPLQSDAVSDGNSVYVSTPSGIVVLDMSGAPIGVLAAPASYQGVWGSPLYIDAAEDGTLWATWTNSTHMVRQLDPASGAVLVEFNIEKPTEFYADRPEDWEKDKAGNVSPTGISVDPSGMVWITDNFFGQVIIVQPDGTVVKRIGEPRNRSADMEFMGGLTAIVYDKASDRMYALEPKTGRIKAFNASTQDWVQNEDGTNFYGREIRGGGPGYVTLLRGVSPMGNGDLLVVDGGTKNVLVYGEDLKYKHNLVVKAGQPVLDEVNSPTVPFVMGKRIFISEVAESRLSVFGY